MPIRTINRQHSSGPGPLICSLDDSQCNLDVVCSPDKESPDVSTTDAAGIDAKSDLGHLPADAIQDPATRRNLEEIHKELQDLLPLLDDYTAQPDGQLSMIDMCIRSAAPALDHLRAVLEAGNCKQSNGKGHALGHRGEEASTALNEEFQALVKTAAKAQDDDNPRRDMSTGTLPNRTPKDILTYDIVLSGPSYPGLSSQQDDSARKQMRLLMLSDKPLDQRSRQKVVKMNELAGNPTSSPDSEVFSSKTTCYIHPEQGFRLGWDFCSLILILMISFVVPLELSFFWDDDVTVPVALRVFNYLVDSFFLVDIVLNFFTAFHEGHGISGILVNDFGGIAAHYVRGWFLLDVVASFPYELFFSVVGFDTVGAGQSSKASGLIKVLRYTKAVRVMKILRVLKLGGLMQAVEEKMVAVQSMTIFFQLSKMTVVLLIMCHNSACAFYFLGANASDDGSSGNWLEEEGLEGASGYSQYVASLYFAITTGTTVGYGDISPTNTLEQAIASVGLVLAVSYIGQFISRASTIVSSLRQNENDMARAKRDALLFMIKRGVNRELQFKVLRYIEHTFETHAVTFLDKRIMGNLSESLQSELALAITGNVFRQFPLFAEVDNRFLTALCEVGMTKRAGVGDVVVWEDHAAHEMFWVVRGEVAVLRRGQHINMLGRNDWFGELALFFPGAVRTATVRCETHCEFLVLHHDKFQEQMREFPSVKREYDRLVRQLKAGDPSGLKLVCQYCGSNDHLTRDCPASTGGFGWAANKAARVVRKRGGSAD